VLAAIGLYGVTAQSVAGRRRELGIRLALGATKRDIAALVLGRGLTLVGAGILAGVVAAATLGQFLSSQLYRTAPTDPLTLLGATLALVTVALIAHLVPLRRATIVDPSTTLRID